jgi:HEAT repeat protein
MGFLGLFGPNVEKLRSKGDALGLVSAMRKLGTQNEAGAALLSLGKAALPAALEGMRDPEPQGDEFDELIVRAVVLGGPAAVEPLMELVTTGSGQTKRRALTALGRLGDRRAVPVIRSVLSDAQAEDWVRTCALEALVALAGSEHVDVVVEALSDGSNLVKREAARLLGQVGDPAAIPILRSLLARVGGVDPSTASKQADEVLGRGLSVDDPQAGLAVAGWHQRGLFFSAAGSLALLGDEKVMAGLVTSARQAGSSAIREHALEQLGRVGGQTAMAVLREALRDPDRDVRWEAIRALGATPDPTGSRLLEEARMVARREDRDHIERAIRKRR